MIWVVLAVSAGLWLLARWERARAAQLRAQVVAAKAQLDAAIADAEARRPPPIVGRRVILPARIQLAALANTDCQAACALYSWLAIRGVGRA